MLLQNINEVIVLNKQCIKIIDILQKSFTKIGIAKTIFIIQKESLLHFSIFLHNIKYIFSVVLIYDNNDYIYIYIYLELGQIHTHIHIYIYVIIIVVDHIYICMCVYI